MNKPNPVADALQTLGTENYTVISGVALPSTDVTVDPVIDYVVISTFGIFCIKTSPLGGVIVGLDDQKYWTQHIRGEAWGTFNMTRQNAVHVQAITAALGDRVKIPIIPIVVLTHADTIDVRTVHHVGTIDDMLTVIRSQTDALYSPDEIDHITQLIRSTYTI